MQATLVLHTTHGERQGAMRIAGDCGFSMNTTGMSAQQKRNVGDAFTMPVVAALRPRIHIVCSGEVRNAVCLLGGGARVPGRRRRNQARRFRQF